MGATGLQAIRDHVKGQQGILARWPLVIRNHVILQEKRVAGRRAGVLHRHGSFMFQDPSMSFLTLTAAFSDGQDHIEETNRGYISCSKPVTHVKSR